MVAGAGRSAAGAGDGVHAVGTEAEPGYRALLSSLLGLRPAPATERFDRVLAQLTAAGRLDPQEAAELRWWQRESLREVDDYLTETVPAALAAVAGAPARADEAQRMAETAWQAATAGEVPADPAPDPGPAPPERPGRAEPAEPTAGVIDLRDSSAAGRRREGGSAADPTPPADTTRPPGPSGRSPLASTRRLLVAGLSALPERPSPA
jgi:hypothetical protein